MDGVAHARAGNQEVQTAERVLTTETYDEESEDGMAVFVADEIWRLNELVAGVLACDDLTQKVCSGCGGWFCSLM